MANTTVKVTKKDRFMEIINIATELGRQDLVDFCNHEIELLSKKKSKETKAQAENTILMATLLEELKAIGKAVTISEFMKVSETVAEKGLSNQKISALFGKMKGITIDREVVKGKAYFFALPCESEEVEIEE